jgi:uncharacterized protein YqhQ
VKAEIDKIEEKLKQKWIMFELEYLRHYSYFQTSVMLLTISILFALLSYLFASIQEIQLLKFVSIIYIPIIAYLAYETYKDGNNLVNLLNDKMKELKKGGI